MFSAAATTLGGHLLKAAASKAWDWTKKNPKAIGRGIGKIASWSPTIGNHINKMVSLASTMAPKDSYIGKMSKGYNETSSSDNSSSNNSSTTNSSQTVRKNTGGYYGAL